MSENTPTDPIRTPKLDEPKKPVSPTGRPRVPAKFTWYFFAGSALCASIAAAAAIPGVELPKAVFSFGVVGSLFFGSLLGLTPGARK